MKSRRRPRVLLSTSNDIATDNRVHKVAMLLQELGFEVLWVGRRWSHSPSLDRPYATHRMKLFFRRGGLFYAEFQLRLFFYLLTHRSAVYVSNDLDTLLPNYLASRLFGRALVYDTHEYFCGVPEIQGRWVRHVWLAVERSLFPRLTHVWTVNQSIADLYYQDYGIRPGVFRNINPFPANFQRRSRRELGLPEDALIAINQGSGMNVDRGLEEALEAVLTLPRPWMLLLVGSGDAIPALKAKVTARGAEDRVHFVDRVPYHQLLQYTAAANVGLSLDKSTNINYRLSLPNKLFDYIHCGLPVVTSPVVEVRRIVEAFGIGETVDPEAIDALAQAIDRVGRQGSKYQEALQKASAALTWERESQELRSFYSQLLAQVDTRPPA